MSEVTQIQMLPDEVASIEADATLSGEPRVFEVKLNDGTSYYFKAYPTRSA